MFNILIRRRFYERKKGIFLEALNLKKKASVGKRINQSSEPEPSEQERVEHKLCFWLCAPLDFVYTFHGRL